MGGKKTMETPNDDIPSPSEGESTPPSRPPGRRGQRQLQIRTQLISGARNVFARVGVAEATIAQITSEANVGFGTFYLYFKTKDDALRAVLTEGFMQLNTQIDELLQHAHEQQLSWEDTLKAMIIAYLHFTSENRDLVQIMLAEQNRSQQENWQMFLHFARRITQLLRRTQTSCSKTIPHLDSRLNDAGTYTIAYPLNLLTAMILAILNRTAVWWLRQHPLENTEQSKEQLNTVGTLVAQFIIAGLTSVLATPEDKTGKDSIDDNAEDL
jgi:AcrR family transcriptional regulator